MCRGKWNSPDIIYPREVDCLVRRINIENNKWKLLSLAHLKWYLLPSPLSLELRSVEHVFQDSPAGVLELGQSWHGFELYTVFCVPTIPPPLPTTDYCNRRVTSGQSQWEFLKEPEALTPQLGRLRDCFTSAVPGLFVDVCQIKER